MTVTNPPTHCQRCGTGLPPHGTCDRLIMVGEQWFCFLCVHAYAEAAMANGIRPGPVTIEKQGGLGHWTDSREHTRTPDENS
jgi:hypothetical protein